jgi:hypothetical protein
MQIALLMYLRESQPESESAERAAAMPRGGRVLIGIQRFIEPHRQTRRWGFSLVIVSKTGTPPP